MGRNTIIVAVAVIMGLIAVFLLNSYFTGIERREEVKAEQGQLVRILVAAQPLPQGTQITPENSRMVAWPARSVPQGAFTSFAALQAGGNGKRVTLRPIEAGEPLLASRLSGKDGRAGMSTQLPEGRFAYAVSINEISGVGGFVAPGDAVDVLVTRPVPGAGSSDNEQIVDVVLENIRVIAIGQAVQGNSTKPEDSKNAKTATLEVDQVGAQKLALAAKVGLLSLALRNITDQLPGPGMTIGQEDLGNGTYRFARRAEPEPALYNMAPAAAPAPAMAAARAAPRRPTGPAVEIVRGTTPTQYEVRRHAGW